jgi:hypothetical protein
VQHEDLSRGVSSSIPKSKGIVPTSVRSNTHHCNLCTSLLPTVILPLKYCRPAGRIQAWMSLEKLTSSMPQLLAVSSSVPQAPVPACVEHLHPLPCHVAPLLLSCCCLTYLMSRSSHDLCNPSVTRLQGNTMLSSSIQHEAHAGHCVAGAMSTSAGHPHDLSLCITTMDPATYSPSLTPSLTHLLPGSCLGLQLLAPALSPGHCSLLRNIPVPLTPPESMFP